MATYAIGDIQGCFTKLQALLSHINFKPHSDQLWFAGDLVNRGPASLATLRFIKSLAKPAVVVLGNHDLHLLAVASGKVEQRPSDTLTEILQAPDCQELCQWLRQQKLLHFDPKLNFAMVHAGLAPAWDMSTALSCAKEVETVLQSDAYADFFANMYGNQPDCWQPSLAGWDRLRFICNCLTRIRFCDSQGRLELMVKENLDKAPAGLLPWFALPERRTQEQPILFGHWAALQGQVTGHNVYALDGGCVWGGRLIAMRLEDGQRLHIPC
jgi:bis(5'-nucleosyl)-tetraphosphatase (symmetrical)